MTDILREKRMFKFWGISDYDHQNLLSFLIQTDVELDEFMDSFYSGDIIRSMIKYQEYKRRSNRMSLEEFVKCFEANKKEALERLFQEPLTNHCVQLMSKYNVTQTEIYCKFQKLSNESYLGIIKSIDFEDQEYSDDFLLEL